MLITAPFRWIWSHKRKTTGYGVTLLVSAYAVVFVLVSCAKSPTAQRLILDDQRTLAYNQHTGSDADAPPVILIHGAPADASSWNKLIKRSDDIQANQILVIDRLGYGNSTDEDELTLAGHAAAIAALFDEHELDKPILVGHSYGGPVALRVAADYPDQVGGIVLVAGACDAYMNDAQWFRRGIDGIRLIVPESWERSNRELLALTDENQAMEPLLDQVRCPVVIVHGTWDGVCPHDSTIAYLETRLTNAASFEVDSISRAGHNLQLSHIDELIQAINGINP